MTGRGAVATALLVVAAASLLAGGARAQQGPAAGACEVRRVPGAVWWGRDTAMTVQRLVSYVAPVYWFSPDEPLLRRASGPAIRIPEPLPFETAPDAPVVYYWLNEVTGRPGTQGVAFDAGAADPGAVLVDLARTVAVSIEYSAYFASEEGLGAHPHDLENTEFKVVIVPARYAALDEYTGGGCSEGMRVILFTRVSAKAHGLQWFWNVLQTDAYTVPPMHLLVEEGKHGLATDKNGDGYYTPGYDVNVRINDAWGVRDIIRTGFLGSGGYDATMTKVRRPEHRVLPPLPDDSPVREELARRTGGVALATYELRPMPPSSASPDRVLAHLMASHEGEPRPRIRQASDAGDVGDWVEEGQALKSLSIAARYDGNVGLSFAFPFFVVGHLNDPMTGGYIVHRMWLADTRLRDFGWQLLYTKSASRWLDTYLAAGAEADEEADSTGVSTTRWDFVAETGLKFRVNVSHSPLKFLTFFTDYWGLRAGVLSRGFPDIDRLRFVLEFGAGSF